MLFLSRQMAQANCVLNTLCWLHPNHMGHDKLRIDPYVNGEVGWYIVDFRTLRAVAFSEYRNSDQIVVYKGIISSFSFQGHSPNEETYTDKQFYPALDFETCARDIASYLFA